MQLSWHYTTFSDFLENLPSLIITRLFDIQCLGFPPQSPWRFTTWLDLADHWQSFIAGLLALVAAGVAVIGTAKIERRKAREEAEGVRSSLAVECRILLARAYGAHALLKQLAQNTPITARQVESLAHMPIPTVYPATAAKIGLLGAIAMDVVGFYGVIEVVVAKADELQRSRTPDEISPSVIAGLSAGFLMACVAGLPLLSKMKTGVVAEDAKDAELTKLIQAAQAQALSKGV